MEEDGRSWVAKKQIPVVTEPTQLSSLVINEPTQMPPVINDPNRLSPVINEPSRLSPVVTDSVVNESNGLSPVANDHLSPVVTDPGRLSPLVGSDQARLSPMQVADPATAQRHLFKKTSPSNQLTLYLPR